LLLSRQATATHHSSNGGQSINTITNAHPDDNKMSEGTVKQMQAVEQTTSWERFEQGFVAKSFWSFGREHNG